MKAQDLKMFDGQTVLLQLAEPILVARKNERGDPEMLTTPNHQRIAELATQYERDHDGEKPARDMFEAWLREVQQPAYVPVMVGRIRVRGDSVELRYDNGQEQMVAVMEASLIQCVTVTSSIEV